MAQLTIKIPASLKKRMDSHLDVDWNTVIPQLISDELKRIKKIEKFVDKSSVLRTKLFRVPNHVTTAWGAFFTEKPKKKPSRKPF